MDNLKCDICNGTDFTEIQTCHICQRNYCEICDGLHDYLNICELCTEDNNNIL